MSNRCPEMLLSVAETALALAAFCPSSFMPLHTNSQLLVDSLESLPLLDNRFQEIRLVSPDPASGDRRGCFSLVFRAHDVVDDALVALKFYDLDPAVAYDAYRVASFHRECEILKTLLKANRCLQLIKAMGTYNFTVPTAGGSVITIGCPYFAVEWLADDIDGYFLNPPMFEAIDKLSLFNDMVLAVQALHRRNVFHRDLKVNNLRSTIREGSRSVVAIDLGTAARIDSAPLAAAYGSPVGAPAYAAPEATCGLAGVRELGIAADTYALGCLLYELFNRNLFYYAIRACNTSFDLRIAAMGLNIPRSGPSSRQVREWEDSLSVFSAGVACPSMSASGSSLPAALGPLLDPLLASLTHIDYRRRPSLELARQRIQIAIKVVRDEHAYQRRLANMRARRQQRVAKLAAKEQRHLRNQ